MQRKHGSIVRALRNDPSVLQRFWTKVRLTDDPSDCWEWLGSIGATGNPSFHIAGRSIAASHVTWFTTVGELPEGGRVSRRCGNPRCVRPNHLAWSVSRTMERVLESLGEGYVRVPGHAFAAAEREPHDSRVMRVPVPLEGALASEREEMPSGTGDARAAAA